MRPPLATLLLPLLFTLFGPLTADRAAAQLDLGDAPAPYPTILNANGAGHAVGQGLHLGPNIDAENDGQPDPNALGDDNNPVDGPDDEDGVTIPAVLVTGGNVVVIVNASGFGFLNAWLDFNINGVWEDPQERIFLDTPLAAGDNTLVFTVPAGASPGASFARFRFSSQRDLSPVGLANDGEVEDYRVQIEGNLDYGDLPNSYQTLLASDGARHEIDPKVFMGQAIDADRDGQPSSLADGDDNDPAGAVDDEDGVRLLDPPFDTGTVEQVEIVVSTDGFVNAWIDWAADGAFQAIDQALFDEPVKAGTNFVLISVPGGGTKLTETYARFRFSTLQHSQSSYFGRVENGEVEDYRVTLRPALDYGDAPVPYPTLSADNGASHFFNPPNAVLLLGKSIDVEPDGQPDANAIGDDSFPSAGPDDEDGVVFPVMPLPIGQTVSIEVEASRDARLDAWMDFNNDGDWADTGEQIFTGQLVVAGVNILNVNIPANAVSTTSTFARFRISEEGGVSFDGPGQVGEVEDYEVSLMNAIDFGDAPDSYGTKLASDGARHAISPNFFMGSLIDPESDGQPGSTALDDDNNPPGAGDDEDGVLIAGVVEPGETVSVTVSVTSSGFIDAWMDFDLDGVFDPASETIFASWPVSTGPNTATFKVPADAVLGQSYARFRLSPDGGIGPTGFTDAGEVEDYAVSIEIPPVPCDGSSKGRDFWLMFPGNFAPDDDNPVRPILCIVGTAGTTGNVDIPGLGFNQTFTIPAAMREIVTLPVEVDMGDANDMVLTNGIHVTASAPVAVFGMSKVDYTSDGFLGIPSRFLGNRYIVQSFGNVHTGVPSLNGTQFGLVACEDETTVTITPSTDAEGHPAGVPYNVVLNRGETYQLRATADAPADLSGTLINSDKKVAVFGSHQCANIPDENTWFCDYNVEQQLPIPMSGRFFPLRTLATRTGGDTVRVFASQDNTTVNLNGAFEALLNQGEHHDISLLPPGGLVSADKVVQVMQFANSSDHDGVVDSDPFSIISQAPSMFLDSYMICVSEEGFDAHYVNVVVPAGQEGNVLLDGVAIPAGDYVALPGVPAFSGAQVAVTPGVHNLTSGGGGTSFATPFGLTVYGWAEYESYGYPGGFYMPDRTPPEVTCLETNVIVEATQECVGIVPDLRSLVVFTDNCGENPNAIVNQTPREGTVLPVGDHTVTMSVADLAGNVGTCTITLTIVDNTAPILTCPEDFSVNSQDPDGAVVTYDVKAFTECGALVPVTCNPPSGSQFPPGETVVVCTAITPFGLTATCSFTVTVIDLNITFGSQPGTVQVNWTGGTLQSAPSPTGPWTDLPGAAKPHVVPASQPGLFFRIRH